MGVIYAGQAAPSSSGVRGTSGGVYNAGSSQVAFGLGGGQTWQALQAEIKKQQAQQGKPGWFKRLVTGAGRNIGDMVTGIPHMASLVGKGAAAPFVSVYGATGLPGSEGATKAAERWINQGGKAVEATGESYKQMYGPLFQGDFKKFGGNVLDNPVNFALDFGGLASVAGKTAGLGAKGARAVGVGSEGGLLDRMAAVSAEHPAMVRAPRVLQTPMAAGSATVRVDRGLMSRNPLYREFVQRPITEPARSAVARVVPRGVDVLLGEQPGAVRRTAIGALGSDARFDRAARRKARDMKLAAEDAAGLEARLAAGEFNRMVGELDKGVGPKIARLVDAIPGTGKDPALKAAQRAERDAVFLHATGLLDTPGLSGVAARDAIVSAMRRGQDTVEGVKRTRKSRMEADRIAEIPEHLLTYETLPPKVRAAVDEARTLMDESQRKLVQAKFMSESTRQEVAGRGPRELLGGESDVSHLKSPQQMERVRELDQRIAVLKGKDGPAPDPVSVEGRVAALRRAASGLDRAGSEMRMASGERWKSANAFAAAVERDMRRAAEGAPDARLLDELLADRGPIGRAPNVGGRARAATSREIGARVRRSMREDGWVRPADDPKSLAVASNADDVRARAAAWDEEYARRVEVAKGKDAEALRELSPAETATAVERELKNTRVSVDVSAERVADVTRSRLDLLDVLVEAKRGAVEKARAKYELRRSSKDAKALGRAERELRVAEGALRVAYERRLLHAGPAARAEAVARGLIDESAPTMNPHVLTQVMDELQAAEDVPLPGGRVVKNAERDAEIASLKAERKLVASKRRLDNEIGELERKIEKADEPVAADIERLNELRDLRGSTRSSAAPVGYGDNLPSVQQFVNLLKKKEPVVATVSPEVDALPAVRAAEAGRKLGVSEYLRAMDEGVVGPELDKLARRVEQAYYLEREARIAGAKQVHGVEWVDNPEVSHIAALPVDKSTGRVRDAMNVEARKTPLKAKRGSGALRGEGNFSIDVSQIPMQAANASRALHHPQMVKDMVEAFAARGPDGKLLRARKIPALMALEQDRWVPISQRTLNQVMKSLDEAVDPRRPVSPDDVEKIRAGEFERFLSKDEHGGIAWQPGVKHDDVVLIPKAVATEWSDAMRGQTKYDRFLSGWKGGMLAFHPRWYLYNLLGNTFQYGLMSMGDVRSVVQAVKHREKVQRGLGAVGAEVRGGSLAAEVGGLRLDANSGFFARAMDAGFRFNEKLEGALRDAAALSATKAELRRAGRYKGGNLDDLLHAFDDVPADSPIVREITRNANLFMGDYRRFSAIERKLIRRVIPFYSWLRVINRLAFSLPTKAPVRLELLKIGSEMGFEALDEKDQFLESMRPYYDRGGITIPGTDITVRTTSANPFSTVVPYVEAVSHGSLNELIGAIAPSAAPGIAPIYQTVSGKTLFGGRDMIAPQGYNGQVTVFGRDPLWIDPTTGTVESAPPAAPSFFEAMAQSLVPFYTSAARGLAQGDRKAYDTVSTPTIIANRVFGWGDDAEIWRKPSKYKTTAPVGPSGLLSVLGSEAGVPIRHRYTEAEIALRMKLLKDYQAGLK